MSMVFTAASSMYLTSGSAVITAQPLSLFGWFMSNDVTTSYVILYCGLSSGLDRWQIQASGAIANDPVSALVSDASTSSSAASSTSYTANTWNSCLGVFTSNSSRTVYLNGGGKVTDTGNITPTNTQNLTQIGVRTANNSRAAYFDGKLAHCACWNVALNDNEALELAHGVLPIYIRPSALVGYWPLMGFTSPEPDLHPGWASSTRRQMTLTNSPVGSQLGPPVQRWSPTNGDYNTDIIVASTQPPRTMHQFRQRSAG